MKNIQKVIREMAIAVLDSEQGITQAGFDQLKELLTVSGNEDVRNAINGVDDAYFIGEHDAQDLLEIEPETNSFGYQIGVTEMVAIVNAAHEDGHTREDAISQAIEGLESDLRDRLNDKTSEGLQLHIEIKDEVNVETLPSGELETLKVGARYLITILDGKDIPDAGHIQWPCGSHSYVTPNFWTAVNIITE